MEDLIAILIKDFGFSQESAKVAIRAKFHCEYCGKDLISDIDTYDLFQIDHILPQSKVTDESLDNFALSCQLCNKIKSNTLPEDPEFSKKTREEKIEYFNVEIKEKREGKRKRLEDMKDIIETENRRSGN